MSKRPAAEFRKFSTEEKRKLLEERAQKSNRELAKEAALSALILNVLILVIKVLSGDLNGEPVWRVSTGLLFILFVTFGIWYGLNTLERKFAQRKLEKLKHD